MLKPEALADLVVGLVKNALAPFAERVASVETRIQVLGDVRDRVVGLEVKAASPVISAPIEVEKVDLTPMIERLASIEAYQSGLGDVRDRVIRLEVKSSTPPALLELPEIPGPVDLGPVLERLSSLEGQLKAIGDVRDRVISLEVKAAVDSPEPVDLDLKPVVDRLLLIESEIQHLTKARDILSDSVRHLTEKAADVIPPVPDMTTAAALVDMTRELVAIRERLAVVESRAPIPGPQGPAGRDGKDGISGKDGADGIIGKDGAPGRDGKDGSDGVTLDDLSVEQQGERTMVVKATVGAKVKEIGAVTFPVDIYRGVWLEGKQYEPGDGVTWAGSVWHCSKETTEKPGDGSKAWRLKVKRGSDGRDGRDAPGALPVVRAR